jgi:hypothetical protein
LFASIGLLTLEKFAYSLEKAQAHLTSLVDDYFDDVISRLVALKRDARAGIERAIEVVQSNGRVFVFGTEHSHVIAEETHYRAGGVAITVPILTGATTVKDGRWRVLSTSECQASSGQSWSDMGSAARTCSSSCQILA